MSESELFKYDQVLYPNYLHTQTHPDRLAVMTRFFGVNSKPVEKCRVLELGCGTGNSLLNFAYDLPDSEFVGIDLSEKQIELGKNAIKTIGLKNLELIHGDIMQINRENFGEFDYIIAHGLYSWVPDFVRNQILNICRETLTENGVAFVSYNVLPGGHLRHMMRDMMRFHAEKFDSPMEKTSHSLALLSFIAQAAPENSVYKYILSEELKNMRARDYENIFHDELSEINQPVYFYEFAAHAAQYKLQFVTEVEHLSIRELKIPKENLKVLEEISDDFIQFEQYLDFIKNRRFRQSLLCRSEVEISRTPNIDVLRDMRIASKLQPESKSPELSTAKGEDFTLEQEGKIEISHPLTKASLFYLGKIWAHNIAFDELVNISCKLLNEESGAKFQVTEDDEKILTQILFQLFCLGIMQFYFHKSKYTIEVSERPLASPIARWQAQNNEKISNLLCVNVELEDNVSREILKILDGTNTRTELLESLKIIVNSSEFHPDPEIKKDILKELPIQLEKALNDFAELGLLVS